MSMFKAAATIFGPVTIGIFVVELARGVHINSSIVLAVICGCGATCGGLIGMSLSKKTKSATRRDDGSER